MPLDVSLLRQLSSENLSALFRQIPGDKDLIIEPSLMKSLDKIAGMALLKSCGVSKVFRLDKASPPGNALSPVRVYLVNSSLIETKYVVQQIKATARHKVTAFHLICFPKVLQSTHVLLEEEGLAGTVTTQDYSWQLIPVDADLLSLELTDCLRECFVKDDLTFLGAVSKSIFGLETLFGKIPSRTAIGQKSQQVLAQLKFLESSSSSGIPLTTSEIGNLFLMDRSVDYASCLLSPVTYEALLDEVYGISCGIVDFSSGVKLQLSSKDKTFSNIRYRHFSNIFGYLSSNAKQLKQDQARASGMNVTEMKQFVQQNLRDMQNQSKAISTHIGASETIQKEKGSFYEQLLPLEHEILLRSYKDVIVFLEDCLCRLFPKEVVLRLVGLLCYVQNGLLQEDHARLKQRICEAYGYKTLSTLSAMESMGLFCSKATAANTGGFAHLAQKLQLLPKASKSPNDHLERDPSFVFNGVYTPVICKIVGDILEQNQPLDFSRYLPGILTRDVSPSSTAAASSSAAKYDLIYFVGGFTMAEVAALRTLQGNTGRQFLIAGTSNVTGKQLISVIGS